VNPWNLWLKSSLGLNKGSIVLLRIVLEPSDEGGFTALVPALPGCISQGDTRQEALENIQEAIALYLESVDDDYNLNAGSEVLEIAV
jgi:predicted RNase H-like HicB family nuclease